tara:strand:+ start:182 stop:1534 length:1353 start_codon:yes stop_codon:yes gene_type:complete
MFIIEGTFKGQNIKSRTCFILATEYGKSHQSLFASGYGYVNIKDNLVSVDVVAQEQATGGGVQGAAGGAVLGFLIAGPLGTAIGAGMGSKKKGQDNTTLAITWTNGDVWVVDRVDTKEYAALRTALATSKPKAISSSKPKKRAKKKDSLKDRISIKKPKKLPEYAFLLKPSKGRKEKDKTKLPNIPHLEKILNLDASNSAKNLFNKNFQKQVENYNNWKWVYFDLKIETEKEINIIAQQVLKKLIVDSNKASTVKDNSKELEEKIKALEEKIKDYKSQIKLKNQDLEQTGFFSKGGIKKDIKNLEHRMTVCKDDLSKAKRSLTNINKKITSLKEIKAVEKGSEEFVSMFSNTFPDQKKPAKTLKSNVSFGDDFFLSTYKKVFDETWDKKINDEIKELKEKDNIEKEAKKSSPKETKTSKKDKLIELKELLDEELISNEEYKESRKEILGQ